MPKPEPDFLPPDDEPDFDGAVMTEVVGGFGAEDVGISNGLLKILDHKAKLPMTEAVDSLNVSVACAVVFYETIRQRR